MPVATSYMAPISMTCPSPTYFLMYGLNQLVLSRNSTRTDHPLIRAHPYDTDAAGVLHRLASSPR